MDDHKTTGSLRASSAERQSPTNPNPAGCDESVREGR
jgi:hypothetical protein